MGPARLLLLACMLAACVTSLRAGVAAAAGDRMWSLYAAAGIEIDDNVSVPQIDRASEQSDVAGVFDLGGALRLVEGPSYEAELAYDFSQSLYADLSDANLQLHMLSLGGSRDLGPVSAGLDYRFTGSTLGGDRFLLGHELFPNLAFAPVDRAYVIVGYDFQSKDFALESARDALVHALAIRAYVMLGERLRALSFSYRVQTEDASGREFDWDGQALGGRLWTRLAPGGFRIDVDVGYRFEWRDYESATSAVGGARRDRRHRLDLGIERRLVDPLLVRLAYEYFRSDSNLPEADYDNHILGLRIGFEL